MVIEYWIIIIYMLFLAGMGLVQKRLNSDTSDYFRGGCRGTWWLVGTSAFMTGISAYTFTAAAGIAFDAGFSALIVYISNCLGYLFCAFFIAHRFRQLRAITAPDIIEMRFGAHTRKLYAWVTVLQYIVLAGLPLYALSLFVSAVFGFNIYHAIIIIGGIVLFYSTTGGKWAVMSNDFLQSLVMFSITILVAILTLNKTGGFSGFLDLIRENQLTGEFSMFAKAGEFPGNSFTPIWTVAIVINSVIVLNTLFSAPRYFSVKDGKDARKAAFLSAVLMFIGSIFWFLPSMAARIYYAQEVAAIDITKPSEASYAIIAMNILPNGMLGLVIVAMFAATMSSLDSGFNGTSAIIVRNIFPDIRRLLGKDNLSEKGQLLLGQISTVVIGSLVMVMALIFASNKQLGIFEILLTMTAVMSMPLAVPMLLCLFIRKVPSWSAIFTLLIGLVAGIIGYYSDKIFGVEWTFQKRFLITFIVSVVSFMMTSFFYKYSSPEYKKKVDDFFSLMHKPVDFEKEVGGSLDNDQFKTIGMFVMALGAFISILLILPNPLWGRLCIVSVFVFIAGIGCVMYKIGTKPNK